jgi:ZIP family zinc transporter
MGEAILFGVAASSALVIGGFVGAYLSVPQRIQRLLLAFAAGALICALSIELFGHAFETAGAVTAGIGLLLGAVTFAVIDAWIERRVSHPHPRGRGKLRAAAARGGAGYPLFAAVVLDGVPENTALGVSLVEDASFALLVAIFVSNLPEAIAGANAMCEEGRSRRFAVGVWVVAAVVLAVAVVLGYALLDGVGEDTLALLLAFAGGAVLASLAESVMPDAFERGDWHASFACAAGFFVSFVLAG